MSFRRLAAPAGCLLAAVPAFGQQPVFVPSYVAPVQPGVRTYVAPIQPGVDTYVAPVGVPGRWVSPYATSRYDRYQAPPEPTAPPARPYESASQSASSPLLGGLFGKPGRMPVNGVNDIHVMLPDADAVVAVNGVVMKDNGWSRHISVEGLERGKKSEFTVTATWSDGGKPVKETRVVHLDGTGHALADFR